MGLGENVQRIATLADAFAAPGESLVAVLPSEPWPGARTYLCAFAVGETRTWLALDEEGAPVRSRNRVREAASIAALCEVAEEAAASTGVDAGPRLASPAYLDALGTDASGETSVATAIQGAFAAVDELALDVERNYKIELM